MNPTGPRLVFVNRYYWPEETATGQLLTDLAEALAARGREVTVISRSPAQVRRGVRLLHVPAPAAGGSGVVAKARHFASFFFAARRILDRQLHPGDCLICLTDPPLLGAGAAAVARRRRARLFHWIQDIYPEVAEAVAGGPGWSLFRPWRDRAWRQAEACVTLGEDMAALVSSRGVSPDRLRIQPNWAPAGLGPPSPEAVAGVRAAWALPTPDTLVVGYSGNLGRVHDLEAVLALADSLREDSGIVFQFSGGGPQRARIERLARERGLGAVRFVPPAPRDQLAAHLGAADLHLVTLRPGCERCVFPSKLYGAAAVGRPVIFLGPPGSGIARQIEGSGLGRSFAPSDPAAAAAIRDFREHPARRHAAGAAALQFARSHSGPDAAAERWDRLTA